MLLHPISIEISFNHKDKNGSCTRIYYKGGAKHAGFLDTTRNNFAIAKGN